MTVRRTRGPQGRRPRRAGKGSEHYEQVLAVQTFRSEYPDAAHLLFAIPNGAKTTKAEGARLKDEGVLRGVPDLFLSMARGGYFGLYVEMKRTSGGSASPEQRTKMAELRAQGYRTAVCHGAESGLKTLRAYMALAPTERGLSVGD